MSFHRELLSDSRGQASPAESASPVDNGTREHGFNAAVPGPARNIVVQIHPSSGQAPQPLRNPHHVLAVMAHWRTAEGVSVDLGRGALVHFAASGMSVEFDQGRFTLGVDGTVATTGATGGRLRQLAVCGGRTTCLVSNDRGERFQIEANARHRAGASSTRLYSVVLSRLDESFHAAETLCIEGLDTAEPAVARIPGIRQIMRSVGGAGEQPLTFGRNLLDE
ncbi:MAG: hypothetical protein WED00_13490 [Aquisalimonadaceae bacterium]